MGRRRPREPDLRPADPRRQRGRPPRLPALALRIRGDPSGVTSTVHPAPKWRLTCRSPEAVCRPFGADMRPGPWTAAPLGTEPGRCVFPYLLPSGEGGRYGRMRGPGSGKSEVHREAESPHPPLRGTFSRGEKVCGGYAAHHRRCRGLPKNLLRNRRVAR
jgi:hypothetical protein